MLLAVCTVLYMYVCAYSLVINYHYDIHTHIHTYIHCVQYFKSWVVNDEKVFVEEAINRTQAGGEETLCYLYLVSASYYYDLLLYYICIVCVVMMFQAALY